MTPKRYLVTAALPYANGPLHIGHLVGCYIPSDLYVRYLRMMGEDILFICGSDEFGAAITMRAKKEGITPQEIVDKYHEQNKKSFAEFGITFDNYHRTSADLHRKTAADIFKKLYEDGIFEEKENEQYYDEAYNQFLADRYITGTCPKCGHGEAYGDQCENCGSDLSPTELIEPVSTLSKNTPVLKTTKHWYLPMKKYEDWVREWVDGQQDIETWKKHVYGQCKSWLDQGLQSRSMTRDLDWGIKVPLPDADGKVLYVWLDAPIGYISATKDLTDDWAKYWKSKDTKLLHFIGKDNIVFHCVIFPIILKLLGDYVLPTNVPANQFLNLEGGKMSTSRNRAVWVHEYLTEFPDQQDILRYALTSNMPENKDADFSWEDFRNKNNNELVDILGGFVHRTLVLTHKYFDGKVPEVSEETYAQMAEAAKEVEETLAAFPKTLDRLIHAYQFRNAQAALMNLARVGNRFLSSTEPWKLIKQNEAQTAAVLSIALRLVNALAVYLEPVLPHTALKIQGLLNLDEAAIKRVLTDDFVLPVGHPINKPKHLFKRMDEKVVQVQREKLQAAVAAAEAALAKDKAGDEATTVELTPLKDTIVYEDFSKLDIRTGTILTAEKMKKTNKLLKLTIDIGLETRTVVSGIAKHYDPEKIVGQKVLLLANLAPRKLRGVESQGMILMAEDQENLVFVAPTDDANDGSTVA